MHVRSLIALLALLAVPATVGAQMDRLPRGGHLAIIDNRSGCTVTVDGNNNPIAPFQKAVINLQASILDAITADGRVGTAAPRVVRANGRQITTVAYAQNFDLSINGSCAVSSLQSFTIAERRAQVENRVRELRGEIRKERITTGITLALSAAAFVYGAQLQKDGSDNAYAAYGAGAGLLIGPLSNLSFAKRTRADLAWNEGILQFIDRPF